jgi:uncharacterized repeat protein (TIGR01451 family)
MVLRSRTAAVGIAAAALVLVLGGCAPRHPWRSVLVSVDADGNGGNGTPEPAVISPDGTMVVFESFADDLGPVDTNGTYDLYLRDLSSGTTRLVATNAAGTDSGNGSTTGAVFSPDGTKLAFTSLATDLGPPDSDASDSSGGEVDAYILDLATGTITMASANAAGTDSGNAPSGATMFSPDGSKLLMHTQANDLGPTDTNIWDDSYLYDLATGEVTLAAPNAAGTNSWPTGSTVTDFSADGDRLLYETAGQVYVRDLDTGAITLASPNATGTGGANGNSQSADLSADGTRVVFTSWATDLGPTDTNGSTGSVYDVYVRDLTAGTTSLVSVNAAGTDAGNLGAYDPFASFSPDGTLVAFSSSSSDLVPDDTNTCIVEPPRPVVQPCPDAFVHDLTTGVTTLVSANAGGTDSGDGPSLTPTFSPDGTRVLFASRASDLGPVDSNDDDDVFVRDLLTGTVTLVSANAEGTDSANASSFAPSFGPDGTTVAFESSATDLDPEGRGGFDIYLATLHGADLSVRAHRAPAAGAGTTTYEMAVTNEGPDNAASVTTALVLPERTTFTSSSGDGSCAPPSPTEPRVVRCALADLAVDTTVELTITTETTIPAGTPHPLPALVGVTAETLDPDRANNITIVDSDTS